MSFRTPAAEVTGAKPSWGRSHERAADVRAQPHNLARKMFKMADENQTLEVENPNPDQKTTENEEPSWDSYDPIVQDYHKALKEVEEEEKAKSQTEEPPEKKAETQEKKEPEAVQDKEKPSVMIPKERLDDALSKLDREKSRADYLQGIVDTQRKMGSPKPDETEQGKDDKKPTEDFETLIKSAEDEKLAIADDYENGVISFKEAQQKQIELDRKIRGLDAKRVESMVESAKKTSVAVVQENNRQIAIETEASKIQAEHPYVNAIDQLPPAIRDGVWAQIHIEAVESLKEKGVRFEFDAQGRMKPLPYETHIALIKEKAALTDKYGPEYTKAKFEKPEGKKEIPDIVKQRQAKIELASQQPPTTRDAGYGADRKELTEEDILNMTDDELADLHKSNPDLLKRATGLR